MKLLTAFACLALAACDMTNPSLPAHYEGEWHSDRIIDVGSGSSTWFWTDIAVTACNLWAPEGLKCQMTDGTKPIDAFVVIDSSPCQKNAAGAPIGTTNNFATHTITIYEDCLVPNQRRDSSLVLAALGHQFGHLLGIAGHVPVACADKQTKGCGLALMNPVTTTLFAWETLADDALFQTRNVTGAIGHAPPPPDAGTTSALTAALPSAPPVDVDCALPLPAHAP